LKQTIQVAIFKQSAWHIIEHGKTDKQLFKCYKHSKPSKRFADALARLQLAYLMPPTPQDKTNILSDFENIFSQAETKKIRQSYRSKSREDDMYSARSQDYSITHTAMPMSGHKHT